MTAFRAGDFRVTQHAVIRYCQRVKPCLTVVDARRELRQIIPFGELRPRPEWASNCDEREQFLFIGDGIAFPVEDGHLLTCVVKGSLSPEARLRRAEKPHSCEDWKAYDAGEIDLDEVTRRSRRREAVA